MTAKRKLQEKIKTVTEIQSNFESDSEIFKALGHFKNKWTLALQKETKRKDKQDSVVAAKKKRKR